MNYSSPAFFCSFIKYILLLKTIASILKFHFSLYTDELCGVFFLFSFFPSNIKFVSGILWWILTAKWLYESWWQFTVHFLMNSMFARPEPMYGTMVVQQSRHFNSSDFKTYLHGWEGVFYIRVRMLILQSA